MSDWKQYLSSLYFNPKSPSSTYDLKEQYQTLKSQGNFEIGRQYIQRWLQDQEPYSLTSDGRGRYPRSYVIEAGLDSQ